MVKASRYLIDLLLLFLVCRAKIEAQEVGLTQVLRGSKLPDSQRLLSSAAPEEEIQARLPCRRRVTC